MSRFKMIASGYAIFRKNNHILLMRRCNTGFEDGNYGLPAGHIENNESITTGTIREISEEIGLIIPVKDLKLVHVMHRRGEDIRMDFFFEVTNWTGDPTNCEPEKCDDLNFFPLTSLPSNTVDYIEYAIKKSQEKKMFSEFGWDSKS